MKPTKNAFTIRSGGLSLIGQAAIDYMFPHAEYRLESNRLTVVVSGREFPLELRESVASGKTRAVIPPGLLDLAADVRLGGGAANSAIAIRLAAPDVDLRYLDCSAGGELVRTRLAYKHFVARFAGLRETPVSAVLGADGEKLIVRSIVKPALACPDQLDADLAWAAQGVVLANSVKDIPVMEYLVKSAEAGMSKLAVVLTNSLPGAFVRERELPNCAVAIASYDEFHQFSGFEIPKTLDGALTACSWMRRFAPSALLFMTMGAGGVLVVDEHGHATRVALRRPAPWNEVQATAGRRSTMLAGVGDCFAGGVVNALVNGETCMSAAVSASALAVRWMGHDATVSTRDFTLDSVGFIDVMRLESVA